MAEMFSSLEACYSLAKAGVYFETISICRESWLLHLRGSLPKSYKFSSGWTRIMRYLSDTRMFLISVPRRTNDDGIRALAATFDGIPVVPIEVPESLHLKTGTLFHSPGILSSS